MLGSIGSAISSAFSSIGGALGIGGSHFNYDMPDVPKPPPPPAPDPGRAERSAEGPDLGDEPRRADRAKRRRRGRASLVVGYPNRRQYAGLGSALSIPR